MLYNKVNVRESGSKIGFESNRSEPVRLTRASFDEEVPMTEDKRTIQSERRRACKSRSSVCSGDVCASVNISCFVIINNSENSCCILG